MRGALVALVSPFAKTSGLARWMLAIGTAITGCFVLIAILAPWLAPYHFNEKLQKRTPPNWDHIFGTNDLEYDVLSRVIWGARTAIEVVGLSNKVMAASTRLTPRPVVRRLVHRIQEASH